MKTGYDQYFKKAQKIAAENSPPQPVKRSVQSQDAKILAQQLRQRVRPKVQRKVKKTIPWKLVGVSFIGLMITTMGLLHMEDVEKFVHRVEFSLLGQAHAEDVKAPAAKQDGKEAAAAGKAESAEAGKQAESAAAKKEYTEEEINHFAKLNERKRELDAREEELSRMEQELLTQKTELDKRLSELENTRRNISSVLEEKVQADEKKVENLVQMYSNMKPQQAAKAFEEMDEDLAIEILGRMKKKNAAEIMNLVKAEKVKVLTEKYAGYKRGN